MKRPIMYLLIFEIILCGVIIGNYFLEKETKSNHYSKYYRVKVKELSDTKGQWYYEIYNGDNLLIRQKNIPGAHGNQYFKTNDEAKTIALLVINKLECKMMPNVTIEELDSCNIDFKK